MGELLNTILEIKKSRIEENEEKIRNEISKINEAIIKTAKANHDSLIIKFTSDNHDKEIYKYCTSIYVLDPTLYSNSIRKKLIRYYKKEGFKVVKHTNSEDLSIKL